MFGRLASHGVSLLPVSDTEELSARATAVPSITIRSECVSSRGTPALYGVVSHRCVPFLLLYTIAPYINIAHLKVI